MAWKGREGGERGDGNFLSGFFSDEKRVGLIERTAVQTRRPFFPLSLLGLGLEFLTENAHVSTFHPEPFLAKKCMERTKKKSSVKRVLCVHCI